MFRKFFMACFCCVLCCGAIAQQNKPIAPFKIRLVNGEGFTSQQLKKDQPVILVYFSPTCDHCKAFAQALLQRKKALQAKQIVMISYEHIRDVQQFDNLYHLSAQPNIRIGSEGYTFVVQRYYQIQHFPFVAEYDKTGKLVKLLREEMDPKEMAEKL